MIVVEERLTELFNLLPVTTFVDAQGNTNVVPKPKYHFGDAKEANAFIKARHSDAYPLIYQTSNREIQYSSKRYLSTDLEFIICTVNRNKELLNDVRWATSYRNILMPLFEKIDKLFRQSRIMRSEYEYTITKHPNFGETEVRDKNAFIDVVDAIAVRVRVEITDACVNEKIFF